MTNKSDDMAVPETALASTCEKIFATVVAVMLFIGFPLWVVLDVGSKAFCRIYECPINRTVENN